MDRRQKSTLRKYQLHLADELILDEDFYAALRQSKLFNDSMLATIKAKSTEKERVHAMLSILPKRGPEAFNKFVGVLKENFSWLADKLEDSYAEMCRAQQTQNQFDDDQTSPKVVKFESRERTSSFEESTKSTKVRQTYSAQYSQLSATTIQTGPDTPQLTQQSVNPWGNLCLSVNLSFQNDCDGFISANHGNKARLYTDGSEIPTSTCTSPRKTVNVQITPRTVYARETNNTHSQQTGSQSSNDIYTDGDQSEDDNDVFDGCPNISRFGTVNVSKQKSETNTTKPYNKDLSNNEISQKNESQNECKTVYGELLQKNEMHQDTDEPDSCVSKKTKESTNTTQLSFEQQNRLMANMYMKLQTLKKMTKERKNSHASVEKNDAEIESDVSLEMLDDLIDELTDMPPHEDTVMIQKSYKLIIKRDQKLPLDVCIQNLNEVIQDLTNKLCEEEKKSNKMVDDMYELSEEKKKLDRIKARDHQLDIENTKLKEKCKELETMKEELVNRIKDLEYQNQILQMHKQQAELQGNNDIRKEEKRLGKRLGTAAKRPSLAQVGRKPGVYPSSDPRIFTIKNSYPSRPTRGHLTATKQKRL